MTLSSIALVVCFELFSSEEPVAGSSAAATAETESDQDGCSHDGPHHCEEAELALELPVVPPAPGVTLALPHHGQVVRRTSRG